MAELAKKLYIKKGTTQQTAKIYSTTTEVGNAYVHLIVDGAHVYMPLGGTTDSRATIGRVKETSGTQFAILSSGKPPYHKDSYTSPGTYTWACPAGVTKARVTIAGGGGGGIAVKWVYGESGHRQGTAIGGRGANNTSIIGVVPNHTYIVVVGAGGSPYVSTNATQRLSDHYAGDGGVSSFDSLNAAGGQGGYYTYADDGVTHNGASYGSGGAGGSAWYTGANAGGRGWVYVEYGGDI